MPVELQKRVHEEVELTKRRSGWGHLRHILGRLNSRRMPPQMAEL